MKWLLVLCLLISPAWAERVCSVYDGDTLTTCNGVKVRLWGVDAPEKKQALGLEAREHLRKITAGREVVLDCHGKSFKRSVCRVEVMLPNGSLDVGREMVGWGYAYDSKRYSKGYYSGAEAFAAKMNRGVWQVPDGGVRPWEWRKAR